jgi:hypothetical protein
MQKKKEYLKDILLSGIVREINLAKTAENCSQNEAAKPDDNIDVLDCDIIYYICGYMVHSYRKKAKRRNSSFCQNCMKNVDISPEDLPSNFTAAQLTKIKKEANSFLRHTGCFN